LYRVATGQFIQKTSLSPKRVKDIRLLRNQREERLIEGVQSRTILLTTAMEIARSKENVSTTGEDCPESQALNNPLSRGGSRCGPYGRAPGTMFKL